jgi:hypothetical protein
MASRKNETVAASSDINSYGSPAWQADQDLRTLCQAEEIRDDPKRLKAAQKLAKDKCEDLDTIAAMTPEKNEKKK